MNNEWLKMALNEHVISHQNSQICREVWDCMGPFGYPGELFVGSRSLDRDSNKHREENRAADIGDTYV